ncbi:phage integrase family protein [Streptomyces sp. 3211.6]|uniref:tyrosine-type recombinase/integrase n=1 Tax=Streptomyces sp. 3211.6 TaxID=1938845 RepID=UPI000EAB7EC2|nr:site-specific integrase [Streptomyces sp. 3211.6]RKT08190.1 phage integrase family protein [Streptomyces sp. 3211.6]
MRVVAPPTLPSRTDDALPASDAAPSGSAAEWKPWPTTLLSEEDIIDRIAALPALSESRQQEAARGVRMVLAALRRAEGSCWQERWHSGGWNQAPDVATLFGDSVRASAFKSGAITHGLGVLLCLDVVRPSYDWLGRFRFTAGFERLRQIRDAEFFNAVRDECQVRKVTRVQEQHAVRMLTIPLAHTGKAPRGLTSQDMLDMCRVLASRKGQRPRGLTLAWDLLRQLGVLPSGTPTLHDAQRRQRPTIPDMVDFYGLSCPDVRDLIIRYVTERAPAIDYSTTRQLIWKLAKRFWKDLEEHHPGIDSLHLSCDVAQAWKKRMGHDNPDRPYEGYSVLFAVRAFYLDISQWALHDAYWAQWAAPCPVSLQDTKGVAKHRKHVTARMHQKVRQLAPLLPQLMASVEERLRFQQEFIDRARAVAPGEEFVHGGRTYHRRRYPAVRDHDPAGLRRLHATDPDTGTHVDLLRAEERAFWTWAVVNTFFYTGVRVEELLEITQTALTTLRLPDSGETVPLLQIVPSKTDAERVLLVPPELAHVLAKVKQRVRDGHETVPVLQRWDPHDRVLSPPLPFLFQRRHGLERRVLTDTYVQRLVNEALTALGHGELKLTPHDFRRLFASEAVSSGLPPHIVAKILGHEHLSTTEHYMAVYPEDMLRHYRAFLARRRQLRPSEEYRDPTSEEWEEFHQHFAKRKVELGTCGRGYGTPCAHEHACLRCPLLQPDPAQKHRLDEIIVNLRDRLTEAHERGWLGEVEGLEITIAAAEHKLAGMTRQINLGMPVIPPRRQPDPS